VSESRERVDQKSDLTFHPPLFELNIFICSFGPEPGSGRSEVFRSAAIILGQVSASGAGAQIAEFKRLQTDGQTGLILAIIQTTGIGAC
jgi:hypothetical protein